MRKSATATAAAYSPTDLSDADGNLLSDGARTYTWDAENRLVGIGYPGVSGKATAFAYDGLSRRVAIASTPAGGGSAVTTSYLWCGSAICQARNASNATTREYLDEGEYVPGATPATYYYGPDQIGSVRRVFASTSSAPAFGYDPYGVPLQTTTPTTDFNYAGMFTNADSGLDLSLYRAYDPIAGRWLSRDPIGEVSNAVGNLYPYVNGNPISSVDPDGRFGVPGAVIGALVGGLGDAALQLLRNGGTQCFSLPEALGAAAVGALIGATDGFAAAPLLEEEAAAFGGAAEGAEGIGAFSPINPGPLASDIANTFRSATYEGSVLSQDTTLYRVIGEGGNPVGAYWTATQPAGPLQSVIESALDQSWGNTATTTITRTFPAGTQIYSGAAAAQGGLVGGGSQIYIPGLVP